MPEQRQAHKRKYDNETRRRKRAALSRRIAAATAELHASQGAAATSYADIARQAGVSLPTVYSHYPNEEELFRGCTSHVAETAPTVPIDEILQADDLPTAIGQLVKVMESQHRYYEPWLAWRMDGYVACLAEMSAGMRRQQSGLVDRILSHYIGPGKRQAAIAGCETFLSFDCWHRLVRGHKLSYPAARQVVTRSILSIIDMPHEPESAARRRRKTS